MKYDLVTIHGWGGSKKSLGPLGQGLTSDLKRLGHEVNLVMIELPGFGKTKLPGVWSLDDYSEYIRKQLRDKTSYPKGESQLLIVGHSVGGKLILNLLRQGKLGKAQLVLINSSGVKPRNDLKKLFFKLLSLPYQPIKWLLNNIGLAKLQSFFRKAIYKFIVGARDYETAQDPNLKASFLKVVNTHIDPKDLEKVTSPILLLWAAQDKATPLWMGHRLAEAIPSAKLKIVEGETHGLPLKQPQRCSEEIINWLKGK